MKKLQANSSIEDLSEGGHPEGWSKTTLEELCIPPQYGWTTSAVKNGTGLKLLRTTDISSGEVDWSNVPTCEEEPDVPEKYLLRDGDIVVSRAGSVGISYLIKNPPRAVFASYLIRFRPRPPVTSEFLKLFLNSPDYWTAIAEEATGIALPNVNASKLKDLIVPVPPLQEQTRMVVTVRDLLASVDLSRARLARVPKILKAFRQSVLAAACSGRLTEDWREKHPDTEPASALIGRIRSESISPEQIGTLEGYANDEEQTLPDKWIRCSLSNIFSVQTGATPLRKHAEYYENGKIPWVKTGEVQNREIWRAEEFITDLAVKETNAKLFPIGTILIAMYGEGKTRGQVGRLRIAAATNQACAALVNSDLPLITQDYVYFYCLGQYDLLRQKSFGGNQPNLSLGVIKDWHLSVPPIEEQREIVHRVDALFKLADKIEERIAVATKRADRLTQAILAKAFRGELVPTEAEIARQENREFEPASDLLLRIRAERGEIMSSNRRGAKSGKL